MTSNDDGSHGARRVGQLLCLSISGLFGPLFAPWGAAAGVAEAATLQAGTKAGVPTASHVTMPAASANSPSGAISPSELAVANELLVDAQVRMLGDAKVYVSRQGRYLGRTDAMGRHYDAQGRLLGMVGADGRLRALPDYRASSAGNAAHARVSPSAKLAPDDAAASREHQMAAIMPPSARAASRASQAAGTQNTEPAPVAGVAVRPGAEASTLAAYGHPASQAQGARRPSAVVPLPAGRPGQDSGAAGVVVVEPLIASDGRDVAARSVDARSESRKIADARAVRRVQAEPQRLVQLDARSPTRGAAGVRGALAPAGISTQPVGLSGVAAASAHAVAMAAVSHEMTHLNDHRMAQPAGGMVPPVYGGQQGGSHARMRTVATQRGAGAGMRPVVYEPGRIVLLEGADQQVSMRH